MRRALTQFARYALVGLASNAVGFAIYLVLTRLGMSPKLAMSSLYVIGVLQTFVFNKRWTFRHGGEHGRVFVRYCLAYLLGYVINLVVLLVAVDKMGFPHEPVQGIMIFSLAVMLFLLQKFWVFRSSGSRVATAGPRVE